MKFLVDAQLPPSLAAWLRERGYRAEHVEEVALRDADDEAIRDYARRHDCVLVTKDRDFVAADNSTPARPRLLWIRTGNVSNRILFERLGKGWPVVLAHLEAGVALVELR